MSVVDQIKAAASAAIKKLYQVDMQPHEVLVNATKPEFEGDYTVVLFALVKQLKKSPDVLGEEIGKALLEANPALFSGYNIIKGFLNLLVPDSYWLQFMHQSFTDAKFGFGKPNSEKVMVEYSSPNTLSLIHI